MSCKHWAPVVAAPLFIMEMESETLYMACTANAPYYKLVTCDGCKEKCQYPERYAEEDGKHEERAVTKTSI